MYFVYTIIKKIASKINTYFKWFMKQEMKEKESEKWAWQMYTMYIYPNWTNISEHKLSNYSIQIPMHVMWIANWASDLLFQ